MKRFKGFTLIELLIVVAIIAILAAIAVPNFLEAQTRSKVARVRSDLRTMATALESYYIDNNQYPAQASSPLNPTSGKDVGVNDVANAPETLQLLPTFRRKFNQGDPLMTLTTPVAYITSYAQDPFGDTKGQTWKYSVSQNAPGSSWILWSFGPDTDEKTPYSTGYKAGGDIGCVEASKSLNGMVSVETGFYNPTDRTPSTALINKTYDPTNGTTSDGEVYRYKE